MKKTGFVFLVPLLVFPFLIASQAISEELTGSFERGRAFFRSGDADAAYKAFLDAFEARPGDSEVNFYLGRAAFETGHHEMAVMAFERVLIADPSALRVKLEMARAYHKLGANDTARKYANEVLETAPPAEVRANIEKFLVLLDQSEQRNFLRGYVALGCDWDDNALASPSNTIIRTVLGDIVLNEDSSREKADFIYNASAGLSHTYKSPSPHFGWQSSGNAYGADYETEDRLDTLFLDAATGPGFMWGNFSAGTRVLGSYLRLDGRKYLRSHGVELSLGYRAVSWAAFEIGGRYEKKRFFEIPGRDADNSEFFFDATFLLRNFWFTAGLAFEKESAGDAPYSYDRVSAKWALRRELPFNLVIFGSYEFQNSDYDGIADLFGRRRKDDIHYAGAGFEKRMWASADKRPCFLFKLAYQYTHADSRIGLYEFDKNVIYSSFEYRF